MKAILMSFQPTPCSLIASGEKTDEVRKRRPKLETPFKVYIYCTKNKNNLFFPPIKPPILRRPNYVEDVRGNGKVIGEFICDHIIDYEAELWDDNTFERIVEVRTPYDFEEYGEYEYITISDNGDDNWKDNVLCKSTCLTIEAFRKYLGTGISEFCTLHISNLIIYDKPKELSEFRKPCNYDLGCKCCSMYFPGTMFAAPYCKNGNLEITRPPQSWCYVDEVTA